MHVLWYSDYLNSSFSHHLPSTHFHNNKQFMEGLHLPLVFVFPFTFLHIIIPLACMVATVLKSHNSLSGRLSTIPSSSGKHTWLPVDYICCRKPSCETTAQTFEFQISYSQEGKWTLPFYRNISYDDLYTLTSDLISFA